MASTGNSGTMRPSNVTAANRPLYGIKFPFQKANGEFPARTRDTECVQNDLLTLFNTPIRSRVMRPLLGHRAFSSVFEAQGALLTALLQREVRQVIQRHEPRVRVRSVSTENGARNVDTTIEYVTQGVVDTVTIPSLIAGT